MASSKSWFQLSKTEKNFLLLQQKLQNDFFHLTSLTTKQQQILKREVGGTLPIPSFQILLKNKK